MVGSIVSCQEVKDLLYKGKIDQGIIPGGATGHTKPLMYHGLSLYFYATWMDEGPHTYTEAGSMLGPPLKTILRWVIDALGELDLDIIIKSFRCCALSDTVDGSEDNKITCFEPGKQLEFGKEHLQSAVENRHEDYENEPFNLDKSDVEENPGDEHEL